MWDDLKLHEEEIAELKALVTSVLKPIEQERFIVVFSQFDGNNQCALFNRLMDFYRHPKGNADYWFIYNDEPQEYEDMSKEILSLFEGNLFYIKEETYDYRYYADLFSLDV